MNDQQISSEASIYIQSADTSALLECVRTLEQHVRPLCPDLPDLEQIFLQQRKQGLHLILETIEQSDPSRAARLQEVIDKRVRHHPYDYD